MSGSCVMIDPLDRFYDNIGGIYTFETRSATIVATTNLERLRSWSCFLRGRMSVGRGRASTSPPEKLIEIAMTTRGRSALFLTIIRTFVL